MTQQKMADLAGVSVQTLRSLYNGKNVAGDSAQRIAEALELPLDALFKADARRVMLSGDTVRYHHRLISTILSTAVKWQMIPSNPCERVDPPKVEKKEAVCLDEKQAERLLELLETKADMRYKTAVELLLYTGLRRGELCGLEWQDVDFDAAVLHIRRTSLYTQNKACSPMKLKTRLPPARLRFQRLLLRFSRLIAHGRVREECS